MAALAPIHGRANLVVLDVKTRTATALTSFDNSEVDRVSLDQSKAAPVLGHAQDKVMDQRVFHGGMYAIDIDGGRRRDMGSRSLLINVSSLPGGDPDSDEVIVQGSARAGVTAQYSQ